MFPNSDFCDVWTKAKEHLFGPGGSGIKSDNRKEGWIAWADDTDVAIHLDGWEAIKDGLTIDRTIKNGVERDAVVTLKRVLVHEIRHVWQRWELARGNPIPDGDAETDARWFESKWSNWTISAALLELELQIQRTLLGIGFERVSADIADLQNMLVETPLGNNFTAATRDAALAELEELVESNSVDTEQLTMTLAAFDAAYFDDPPPEPMD